jgi:hypothetical protein
MATASETEADDEASESRLSRLSPWLPSVSRVILGFILIHLHILVFALIGDTSPAALATLTEPVAEGQLVSPSVYDVQMWLIYLYVFAPTLDQAIDGIAVGVRESDRIPGGGGD